MKAIAQFLRYYLRPRPDGVTEVETGYRRDGERLPATLYRPAHGTGPLPGWVLLHGLTVPGREHTSLKRFARAVAASGAAVLVPDIPEWRALRVAPAVTVDTIRAAILALAERDDTIPGRIGVIGFSFGATQALVAAADPRLKGHLAAVAAWGGYCDVFRLFRFGYTGEHELDGRSYRTDPDPYGRWIMGANYLTAIPGFEDNGRTAAALGRLAEAAGKAGLHAWDGYFDPLKAELRAALPAEQRPVFDLFAPPAGQPPHDPERAREVAEALAAAALRVDPLLDPGPALSRLDCRVLLAHGRDDRVVPFTETIRLGRALDARRLAACTITGLFEHSGGTSRELGPFGVAAEAARFVALLNRILHMI
ncbi:MAG TPA: dienelactone hydrolase family protein [Longimicrobiales bacterium]|nr:dienelactone hydrolase family protein [Longimicrobiales bacterium]